MNIASLLGGGGGLQSQINPLASGFGGSSRPLGMSGVPNELAGLCALLGNQKIHNVPLTILQVVELQRAVAAQKLATEQQAAAAVQAKIDEKVAEEMKKVAPGCLPVQPGAVPPEKKAMGTATCRHLDLAHLKVRGGELSMLNEPTNSLLTKKHMRSSMELQMNSMGRVHIQVKTVHVERDRQSVVLELRYGRHETDLNRATSWYRTLWQDSNPNDTHFIKMYRPILKDMGATLRRGQCLLGV